MKIGTVTHYHHSLNYGGLLQCYALVSFLKNSGFDAFTIPVSGEGKCVSDAHFSKRFRRKLARFKSRLSFCASAFRQPEYYKNAKTHLKNMRSFRDNSIPHTCTLSFFSKSSILKDLDFLVTGSDQVWNLDNYVPAYFLDFCEPNKRLSYAASFPQKSLDVARSSFFKDALGSFSYLSVRESSSKSLIGKLTGKDVYWDVDPVFLLNKADWESVRPHGLVKCRYILSYFLSENSIGTKSLASFAEHFGLKIVSPLFCNNLQKAYQTNGEELIEVDPFGFLSLIADAEFVFTDSFHASALSAIFEKQFFSFSRSGLTNMDNRLESLSVLLGDNSSFFLDGKSFPKPIGYVKLDYSNSRLFDHIKASKQRLLEVLRNAE